MNKITQFKITNLSVRGFKCFAEMSEFVFDDITCITGANGKGKTSIADAIAYAFAGVPFFGERGADELQNNQTNEIEVGAEFIDGDGINHCLTRTKKYDTVNIMYDNVCVKQSEMDAVFGDKNVFLSIFNPLYFIDVLGDDGKQLLESMLPEIKHEDVMAALPVTTREILKNENIFSADEYIKNKRAEIRECEETVICYKSQMELVKQQRRERENDCRILREMLNDADSKITESEAVRDKNQDIESEIIRLKTIISEREAVPYISQYAEQISKAEIDLKVLYAEHAELTETIKNIVTGCQCPACMTEVTDDNIDNIRLKLQARLAELVRDGKNAKTLLYKLTAKDNEEMQEFENNKAVTLAQEREKLRELEFNKAEIGEVRFDELSRAKVEYAAKLEAYSDTMTEKCDYNALISRTEAEIVRLTVLINEANLYTAKRSEMALEKLKADKTKDCFKFTYDSKPYKWLSLSERINAGLEVSQLIRQLSNRNYPVFIDNAESVNSFSEYFNSEQIITAKVTGKLTELGFIHKTRRIAG